MFSISALTMRSAWTISFLLFIRFSCETSLISAMESTSTPSRRLMSSDTLRGTEMSIISSSLVLPSIAFPIISLSIRICGAFVATIARSDLANVSTTLQKFVASPPTSFARTLACS